MTGTLAAHLWQSTVFALFAAVLTLAFRQNRARIRYWLWTCASLKFLVPFSWLIRLGSRLEWAPAARHIAPPDVWFAIERITWITQPLTAPPPPAHVVPSAPDWTPIAILAVWICGAASLALLRLRLWLRIRAALRASTLLDIPAPVAIRSAPGLLEPGVVGFLRPVLLLPEGILDRLTPSELETVLAHELCHLRRRDNLFAAIHMLVEALFWFHPLVWWIGARMLEERERACDEGVLSLGNQPRIYADAILNVCKLYAESPLVCVSGVTGANLKRRIEAIMSNRIGQSLNRSRKLLLAAAAIAAVAGPLAIGILTGAGNVPAIRAQSPAADPPRSESPQPQSVPATPRADAQDTSAPAAVEKYQNRRLVAMFFDLDSIAAGDQPRMRQAAIDYIRRMQPADLVALLTGVNGNVKVIEDFTDDRKVLESSIQKLSSETGASEPNATATLQHLETAVRMLGVLPQKKLLLYFATPDNSRPDFDWDQMHKVVTAAREAELAFYPMDARGLSQILTAQINGGGTPPLSAASPAGISQEESDRRRAYAMANFGSTSNAAARTYIRYGPPDQKEIRPADGRTTEVWRYNYLQNFHSNVEFELTPTDRRMDAMRIDWPPPIATFTGTPGGPEANTIAGLPGRRASIGTWPAGEIQQLNVPLDSLTGQVGIHAQIEMLPAPGTGASAGLHNQVSVADFPSGVYQASFILPAGSYTCDLTVKELSTGQTYQETIQFEVQ